MGLRALLGLDIVCTGLVGVSAMCALAHQRGVRWDGGLGWAEANVDAHVGWRG